jgi:G2/mitotic-specific cyclin-B, other
MSFYYCSTLLSAISGLQVQRNAAFGYMTTQGDINEKMRAILIDWLNEVHFKFKLMPETLYLTVNLIDRYLERKPVIRQKLQLVGVTAMLLASKYEEIFAPEVRDFVYITDKAYTREQILEMEAWMLRVLEFRISVPTPYVFLNRFLKAAEADARVTLLATYLVERCLQEYKMIAHTPSKLAAAAVNIAVRTLKGRAAWNNTLTFFSGYTEDELRGSVQDVQEIIAMGTASSLQV